MNKHNCNYCGRLLFIGSFKGCIEIKCNKCKQINIKAIERQQSAERNPK